MLGSLCGNLQMNGSAASRLSVSTICLLGLLCLGRQAVAGPQAEESDVQRERRLQQQIDNWEFRFDLFQMLFEQNELRPTQSLRDVMRRPRKSVVVVIGGIPFERQEALIEFVANGGSILFATDSSFYMPRYFRIRGGPIIANEPQFQYRGFPDCLRISQFAPEHPLSEGVSEIVVNQSGVIDQLWRNGTRDVVARAPLTVRIGSQRNRSFDTVILAMKKSLISGSKLIVCADQSLFSNSMMWHGDNARLAINICDELCDEGRNQLLFVVDGEPQNSYLLGPIASQLPLPEQTPKLGPEQLLAVANAVINDVEDQDLFNSSLTNRPRTMPNNLFRRALLFSLLAGVLALVAKQFFAPAAKLVPPSKRPEVRSADSELFQDRTVLRSPESREAAAKLLAEEFCIEVTGSQDRGVWQTELGDPKRCAALIPDAKHRKHLPGILQFALGRDTNAVTGTQLAAFAKIITDLRAMVKSSG